MKTTIKIEKEVDIKKIKIDIAPRYIGDDDMPTDFPLLTENKSAWIAVVGVDTGVIENWPQGEEREMHVKVCDAGSYHLIDESDNVIGSIINSYVPNGIVPGSYGDYVELKIDGTGKITNWPSSPDLSEFFED